MPALNVAGSVSDWLQVLLLGAVAGVVGQLVRAVAGFAKLTRERNAGQSNEPFLTSTLSVSLLIGATAGALAALALFSNGSGSSPVTGQSILGLMAAGYAGADFIEGFAGKNFQGLPFAAGPPGLGGGGAANNNAQNGGGGGGGNNVPPNGGAGGGAADNKASNADGKGEARGGVVVDANSVAQTEPSGTDAKKIQ